jgi:hypothetical protein
MLYGNNLLVSTTTSRVYREKFALKPVNEVSTHLSPLSTKMVVSIEPGPESKLDLSVNFKEFYRAHLSEIQFELKLHKSKLMTYFGKRGAKR